MNTLAPTSFVDDADAAPRRPLMRIARSGAVTLLSLIHI